MDVFFYLFFGFLDVIAILVLIFSIFRFPLLQYVKELIIIGITLSVVSYFDRVWLNIAAYDIAIQFFLYIVFFRYLIRMRLFESLSVVSIGYCSFAGIQFIVYPLLLMSGIVTVNDAQSLTGLGIYIIQFATELSCFVVGFLLYRFNMGFSFILSPPHDIEIKSKKTKMRKLIGLANLVGILTVCSVLYWILNYTSALYIILPSVFISLLLFIYLSYKMDYNRER